MLSSDPGTHRFGAASHGVAHTEDRTGAVSLSTRPYDKRAVRAFWRRSGATRRSTGLRQCDHAIISAPPVCGLQERRPPTRSTTVRATGHCSPPLAPGRDRGSGVAGGKWPSGRMRAPSTTACATSRTPRRVRRVRRACSRSYWIAARMSMPLYAATMPLACSIGIRLSRRTAAGRSGSARRRWPRIAGCRCGGVGQGLGCPDVSLVEGSGIAAEQAECADALVRAEVTRRTILDVQARAFPGSLLYQSQGHGQQPGHARPRQKA